MLKKLKALVRQGKHIPLEYRDPKYDWNAEAETKIYTDESGKPLSREDLQNYDLENLILFSPSNVANQEHNIIKEDTPSKRFHKLLDKSLQDPANPYDAAKAIAGYTFGIPLTATGLLTAPAATIFGTALGTVGDLAGNYLVGKYVSNPDKSLDIGIIDSPTPRQIGSFVGGLIGGAIGARGSRPIDSRYKLAHTPVSTKTENIDYIKRKMPHEVSISANGHSMSENVGKLINNYDGTYNVTGGFIVVPGETVGTHFNPSMQVRFNNFTGYTVLDQTAPGFQAKRDFIKFWKHAPKGMVISNNNLALNAAQIIPKLSWYDRYSYYLFGKNPIKKPVLVDGYSTNIIEQFKQLANKGLGIVTPSLTTRMTGINKFGTNFAEFEPYFTRILDNGSALFVDMTPEMVTKWNREIAPKYGIHIDPKTRTALLLTLIKTE